MMNWLKLSPHPLWPREAPSYINVEDIKSWTMDRTDKGSIVRFKSGGYVLCGEMPSEIADLISNMNQNEVKQ